jgi:hypothetical protein
VQQGEAGLLPEEVRNPHADQHGPEG